MGPARGYAVGAAVSVALLQTALNNRRVNRSAHYRVSHTLFNRSVLFERSTVVPEVSTVNDDRLTITASIREGRSVVSVPRAS
jgi:hypothetical protein